MPLRKRKESVLDPVQSIRNQIGLAILTAKDAIDNVREYLEVQSRMAHLTVRECEEQLDRMERQLDDEIPVAMVKVNERTARELIACLRFITDLERIGDLMWGAIKRYDETARPLRPKDRDAVQLMLMILSEMMSSVHHAFRAEDTQMARQLIARDREIDRIHQQLLTEHMGSQNGKTGRVEVIFLSQALERAGDHVTNLGEELIHLTEEQSVRHERRRTKED